MIENETTEKVFLFFKEMGRQLAAEIMERASTRRNAEEKIGPFFFVGYRPTIDFKESKTALSTPVIREAVDKGSVLLEKRSRPLLRFFVRSILEGEVDSLQYLDNLETVPVNFTCLALEVPMKLSETQTRRSLVMSFMSREGATISCFEIVDGKKAVPYIHTHNYDPEQGGEANTLAGDLAYVHSNFEVGSTQYLPHGMPSYEYFVRQVIPEFYFAKLKQIPSHLIKIVLAKNEFTRLTGFLFSKDFEDKKYALAESLGRSFEARFPDRFETLCAGQTQLAKMSTKTGLEHYEILLACMKQGSVEMDADNWLTLVMVEFLLRPETY